MSQAPHMGLIAAHYRLNSVDILPAAPTPADYAASYDLLTAPERLLWTRPAWAATLEWAWGEEWDAK